MAGPLKYKQIFLSGMDGQPVPELGSRAIEGLGVGGGGEEGDPGGDGGLKTRCLWVIIAHSAARSTVPEVTNHNRGWASRSARVLVVHALNVWSK